MTNPIPQIQLAIPDDAAEVTALVTAAYRKWIEVIGGMPMPMTADYATLIAKQIVYCARVEHELVGVLVIWQVEDALYIDNVAVSPNHQGRGIGDSLLAFAEQKAHEMRLDKLTLLTNEKMLYNQAYYLKHGYSETRRETLPNGRRVVWMHKSL